MCRSDLRPKQIVEKEPEKKCRVYVGFLDLEKAYDRVNNMALWQVLRMYDVKGKLLNGIKSVYVYSLACIRVKINESECFRIDSGARKACILSPWLFNVYINAVMKELKMSIGRRGVRFQEEGKEWRLPGLLCADDLVFCGESEEDLTAIVRRFIEACRKRGLKFIAGKSKVMVLGRVGGDGM